MSSTQSVTTSASARAEGAVSSAAKASAATTIPPSSSSTALEGKEKYDLALLFFKSNADACGKLEYEVTTRLMALSKQAARGKFQAENEPELGWFDFVGTDRRNAWIELGDMSKDDAMAHFCAELIENVSEFAPWLAARLEEKAQKEKEERERIERERIERERAERERKERLRQQELERERLERERQDRSSAASAPATPGPGWGTPSRQPVAGSKAEAETPGGSGIQVDIKQFRDMLQDKPDNCIAISYGEVMRVKVPNPAPGLSTLKWQFCTENHDIGFGLDFESAPSTNGQEAELKTVLPIMRIQADKDVSVGKHVEPNAGSWVIVFDNSYSYLRSKTVYFTVTNSVEGVPSES